MAYSYKLMHKNAQKTSAWSGGTTTELAIFPEDASYAARNFQWRLSTAVVTAAESTFTLLPDWHRLLMVLAGSMRLTHAGHHQISLNPFEQDSFSGSWNTHCVGMGQDFNLMMGTGWHGRLQACLLAAGETAAIAVLDGSTEAFYCYAGQAQLSLPIPSLAQVPTQAPTPPQTWLRRLAEASDSNITMNAGDFLLLQPVEVLQPVKVKAKEKNLAVRLVACHGPVQLIQASINRIESDYDRV